MFWALGLLAGTWSNEALEQVSAILYSLNFLGLAISLWCRQEHSSSPVVLQECSDFMHCHILCCMPHYSAWQSAQAGKSRKVGCWRHPSATKGWALLRLYATDFSQLLWQAQEHGWLVPTIQLKAHMSCRLLRAAILVPFLWKLPATATPAICPCFLWEQKNNLFLSLPAFSCTGQWNSRSNQETELFPALILCKTSWLMFPLYTPEHFQLQAHQQHSEA